MLAEQGFLNWVGPDVRKRRAGLLVSLLLLVVIVSGCSTGGGRSRGSVSSAAAQAAEAKDTDRESGRTRTKNDQWDEPREDKQSIPDDNYRTDYSDANDGRALVGGLLHGIFGDVGDREYIYPGIDFDPSHNVLFWLSRGHPAGDTIENMSTASVMYSKFRNRRWRTHVGLYYGKGENGSHPDVRDGIDYISEFGLQLGAREYLTPRHTFVGLYVIYGLRLGGLHWSYSQAIEVPTDGGTEIITSDKAFIVTPYLGLGTSLMQVKPLHIGASLTWGVRFVGDKTLEEFDNDLFRDTGEWSLNLETSVFF